MKLTSAVLLTLSLLLLAGCSAHKKASKTHWSREEELRMEREEVEPLKGPARMVLEEAFEWLDTPYAYGRQDKGVATDCSGMVMLVFEKSIGCKLPRNSAKQAEACTKIDASKVRPGDLVFFITNNGSKINHVGIMVDKDKFIHASSRGVMVSSMSTPYYTSHFRLFGRPPCL